MDIENASIYDYGFEKTLNKQRTNSVDSLLVYDIMKDVTNPELLDKTFSRGAVNVISGGIQSGNYDPATGGWSLNSNGMVELGAISYNKMTFTDTFSSTDTWTKSVGTNFTITERHLNLIFESGVTANAITTYEALGSGTTMVTDFSKNPGMVAVVSFDTDALSSFNAFVLCGASFGFYMSAGILYTYMTYGAVETFTVVPNQPNLTQMNHLIAVMDSTLKTISYYVNGKLEVKQIGGTNFPIGLNGTLMYIYGKTLGTSAKTMRTHFVTFFQDR